VVTNLFQAEIEVPPISMPTEPDAEVRGNRLPGFPALSAGHYLVEIKTKDASGRAIMSSRSFDVSASAEIGSNYRNDIQLKLKPDRKSYAPGETAQILVESPFTGTALVTVEREKVLRSFNNPARRQRPVNSHSAGGG